MNTQYIEDYTIRTFDTINRIITLNTQLITYMYNFNRSISNMNYINYLSNNNNNNNNNINYNDDLNQNEYFNDLFNIYYNYSIENIKYIVENNLDYYPYNNDDDNEEDREEGECEEDNEKNICPITKEIYKNGEIIGKIKKCNHSFKYDNIYRWLKEDLRCPLCRHNILENSNFIEFKNHDEKLILTREQFINFMKYYYNVDASFILQNNNMTSN